MLLAQVGVLGHANAAEAEAEPIRIRAPRSETAATEEGRAEGVAPRMEGRRGFDYDVFSRRLQALWFQRKAFLAAGRDEDAATQGQNIRALCAEEGVRSLDGVTGALLLEARRYLEEGSHARALSSIEFAEFFAPGSSQVRFARARAFWESGRGVAAAGAELLGALRAAIFESWVDLSLLNHLLLVLLISTIGLGAAFSALMVVRHHRPLRHEVEERVKESVGRAWAVTAGWGAVLLPLVTWFGAGWAPIYWIVVTYRFMRRGERVAAVVLLAASASALLGLRVASGVREITEDPIVRNVLASTGGAYEPERVVKLQNLVETHPTDPTYRFLLAALYKNGRYFEEAYEQYKRVLALDPDVYQAHINTGNVFFQLGQHGEAIVHYRKAIELRPDAVLAYYDAYVAQSESFRFKEAQETLEKGSAVDPEGMAELLYRTGRESGRPMVVDASVDLGSLWQAALEGRPLRGIVSRARGEEHAARDAQLYGLLNPLSIVSLLAILLCLFAPSALGAPARACIRCGDPFCSRCRTQPDKGREYCTQCLHLFVRGDGLAAETKMRKLYEVERHTKISLLTARIASAVLPGAGEVLKGRALRGCLFVLAWMAALGGFWPALLMPFQRWSGLDLDLDLLHPRSLPAAFSLDGVAAVSLIVATLLWLAANARRFRAREA